MPCNGYIITLHCCCFRHQDERIIFHIFWGVLLTNDCFFFLYWLIYFHQKRRLLNPMIECQLDLQNTTPCPLWEALFQPNWKAHSPMLTVVSDTNRMETKASQFELLRARATAFRLANELFQPNTRDKNTDQSKRLPFPSLNTFCGP